jgi:hypothetical protein
VLHILLVVHGISGGFLDKEITAKEQEKGK